MPFSLRKKRLFALTSSDTACYLAEVTKSPMGTAALTIHARTDAPIMSDVAVPRLLSTIANLRGDVSLALPLHLFETLSISLPTMPDGAIGKALPYHLAKAINKPLSDCIYDWQVIERQRDRLQILVYLFPAAKFLELRTDFSRKHLEIVRFEADVFAAFALLARENRLHQESATLCALIWQNSISLAVHEKNLLTLVRTVSASYPRCAVSPHSASAAHPRAAARTGGNKTGAVDLGEEHNILADFDILSLSDQPHRPNDAAEPREPAADTSWADYLQHISLEIMRTRDYYASVFKGGAIKRAVIGGAEPFWQELQHWGRTSLELEMEPLTSLPETADCPPMLQALTIGTGTRW